MGLISTEALLADFPMEKLLWIFLVIYFVIFALIPKKLISLHILYNGQTKTNDDINRIFQENCWECLLLRHLQIQAQEEKESSGE